MHAAEAADYLGWRRAEFRTVAAGRGLKAGRCDRFAKADLDALAADENLVERLRVDRLLTAQQATEKLEMRLTDFKYLAGR